jgi:hypothetical protein
MHKLLMTIIAGACLAALPVLTGAARAELEVKRSTVDGLRVGAKVSETAKLAVPANKEIEFFKLPSGPTYTIKGPYDGTLADYTNPCPWWKAAVGSCKPSELDTGGTRGVEVPGATRGFKRPE